MDYIHDFFTGKLSYDKADSPTTGSLNVYPNPTSGQIKIELNSPTTVEVIDSQGHTILQQQTDSCFVIIDLKGAQSGIYFVKANGVTEKIVIE